jgi:hypothetical protein
VVPSRPTQTQNKPPHHHRAGRKSYYSLHPTAVDKKLRYFRVLDADEQYQPEGRLGRRSHREFSAPPRQMLILKRFLRRLFLVKKTKPMPLSLTIISSLNVLLTPSILDSHRAFYAPPRQMLQLFEVSSLSKT